LTKRKHKKEMKMKAYEFLAIRGKWNGTVYANNTVYKNNEKYQIDDPENIERIRPIFEWIFGQLDRRLRKHWDKKQMKVEIVIILDDLFPKIKFEKSPISKKEIFDLADKMIDNIYISKERQIVNF